MNFDFSAYLGSVERTVSPVSERDGIEVRSVTLSRTYDTTVEDLWDATTNGERLPRWFAPVSGDFTLGGRYQVQGNAGGTIKECDPPHFLSLTWEFGGGVSWVELRLAAESDRHSRLTLTHVAPLNEHWEKYGPGAVGVGWDLAMVGLAYHTARPDGEKIDDAAFAAAPEGKAYITTSSASWGKASIDAGTDPAQAKAAAALTTAFYTGETPQGA